MKKSRILFSSFIGRQPNYTFTYITFLFKNIEIHLFDKRLRMNASYLLFSLKDCVIEICPIAKQYNSLRNKKELVSIITKEINR